MRTLILDEVEKPLRWLEAGDPEPKSGEVLVDLKAAALNRRDYWIWRGLYPGIQTPVILGSDGAGIIRSTGAGVDPALRGREVVINPGLGWGGSEAAQHKDFRILGMPDNGTFATTICIAAAQVYPKPAHLSWPEAAALPLAGVTAYRALVAQGRQQAGEKVLVTGIGGGVATFVLLFAVARGAAVVVTSSTDEKIQRALKLGARGGFNYRSEDWSDRLLRDFGPQDLIIDSAGGDAYSRLIDIAAPGGRIVSFGATVGPPRRFELFKIFWKQLHLIGSTMGSPADFQAMLKLVQDHRLRPVVDDVFPMREGQRALESMAASPQFGKLVLEMDRV